MILRIDIFWKNGYTYLMDKYQHLANYKIKYCDVDFKDELKISTLLAYFEEASCSSADELGFGYRYLIKHGYAFIVAGYFCEFRKPILLGDTVTIKTWPTPPTHVVFGREYQVCSSDEKCLAEATSRWCLVDIKNNKVLSSKSLKEQDYSTYNQFRLFPDWRWKLPVFEPNEGELKFRITIANSEYDHNMHVNNTRYADYCLNCFSVEALNSKRIKRFAINYLKQAKEGDTLSFYLRRHTDGSYLVQGFNDKGELTVQSQIDFEDIE